MYRVSRILVSRRKQPQLYTYLAEYSQLAKNLHNAALFRMRQNFTAYGKTDLTDNEAAVMAEIRLLQEHYGSDIRQVLSYVQLERLMRVTENPDFFSGLPMQTAQNILKQTVQDFKSWLSALKAYRKDPGGFTGKPNMPGYRKGDYDTFTVTNQDAVLYAGENGTVLKLPKTNIRIPVSHLSPELKLREIKVRPFYDSFEVLITLETDDIPEVSGQALCAVDLGVNNTAAIVTNTGRSVIYKGGAVKAANQWFNKERARLVSEVTMGGKPYRPTRKLDSLSRRRTLFMRDYMHKISHNIIQFCIENKVGSVIIGENKGWKQNSNIGHRNNQAFVSVPFDMLKNQLIYKAEAAGICVIMQDETYTSQADFLAGDNCSEQTFSGRRIRRGLYRSATGRTVNADLNAAANIMCKAIPEAFDGVTDFSFLQKTKCIRFKDLYH
jgi:putative transposase